MALANLSRTRELTRQVGTLRGELRRLGRFGALIGASPRMQQVYDLIARSRRPTPRCSSLGESGTGKELVAQTIHEHEPRAATQAVRSRSTAARSRRR